MHPARYLSGALCLALALASGGCLREKIVVAGREDRLSLRAGLLYRAGSPFTGTVAENYPDGTARTRVSYRAGKRHGKSLTFYANGKRAEIRVFARGLKEGHHKGWWESGRKRFEYRFRKGMPVGVAREWYEDGTPAREMRYAQGVEAGLQRAWRRNGVLYSNYEVRAGRQYGVVNARMCYSVKNGQGVYASGH
jgi:antitoxin component YwqK of YwqJK toxin-antitoxin module